jgi:nucleoside phosphorylase/DNA polymerase III delta prime subunit
MSQDAPRCEVVILTALPVEFQAVVAHLQDKEEIVHPTGTIYCRGQFQGEQRTWRVAVAQVGVGGTQAAIEAEKAISYFSAQVALFVGIAGGRKDVRLGEIVVATKIYAYESGKEGVHFEPRPELWHPSHALEQRARHIGDEWVTRLSGVKPMLPPRVHLGPLAAGAKVLASTQSETAALLGATYGDALAVEMESHGFLQAVHVNHAVHGLVIRGIANLIDGKTEAEEVGWPQIAARHAAAFAFQVLSKFTLPDSSSSLSLLSSQAGPSGIRNQFQYSSLLSSLQRQNRQQLLKRVDITWIKGLLENLLPWATWIDLHLRKQPDALENPWSLQVQELNPLPHPLPMGTSIVEIYDDADGELLILGEPGSGKTTLLLQLLRTLLKRAETDEQQCIPVVFNLSSWGYKQKALDTWLVEELGTKYQVPWQVGQDWIKANQVLPLLDGLDEVAEEAREACVQEIITYCCRQTSRVGAPLVICCRTREYLALSVHLPLRCAVNILPLTEQQIEQYLEGAQRVQGKLNALRQALHKDDKLKELAQRPLLLRMFTLAYQDTSSSTLLVGATEKQAQSAIFKDYVERMLERRGISQRWTREQWLQWLSNLATYMRQEQQTIFFLEDLQPDWLTKEQQHFYRWSVGVIGGLVLGLFDGLSSGLLFGWNVGLGFGLAIGLFMGLVSVPLGVTFGAHGFRVPFGQERKIWLAEVRSWSWKGGLVGGVIGGLIGGLFGGQAGEQVNGPGSRLPTELSGVAFGVLLGTLFGGLSIHQLTAQDRHFPNEGIWRSLKNGLILALFSWVVLTLLGELSFGLFGEGSLGLVIGPSVGMIIGLVYGLGAFIQHFVLRIILWRTKTFPWHMAAFLDEAAERVLLCKVGSGYLFVHELLRNYLASPEMLVLPRTPTSE